MADQTGIEWCDATFNPWWGCTRVSPGCDHCYADTWAKRVGFNVWDNGARRTFGEQHWSEPLRWDRLAQNGVLPDGKTPTNGRRPRVFCASMADVFDKDAPEGARERLWDLIADTPSLDWLLLTKRIGNVARMVPVSWREGVRLRNIWLGISVVNQEEADRDIPKLLAIPAHIRFLSCEPLLGPISLTRIPFRDGDPRHTQNALTGEARLYCTGLKGNPDFITRTKPIMPRLHWVISGGESGSKARPSNPDWHRSLRDQCFGARVPFLFKQWGEWVSPWHGQIDPEKTEGKPRHDVMPMCRIDGTNNSAPNYQLVRVGKKIAGRSLDGCTHDEYPTRENA